MQQSLAGPITADTAASVTEIARWGGGAVIDLAYSPGGDRVALATTLGVEVHDAETMAELPFLSPEPGWSLGAISRDWQTVAWKSGRLIRLQHVSDGQVLHTLEGEPGWVGRVTFSPDGQYLVTGSEDGTVRLWGVPAAGQSSLPSGIEPEVMVSASPSPAKTPSAATSATV